MMISSDWLLLSLLADNTVLNNRVALILNVINVRTIGLGHCLTLLVLCTMELVTRSDNKVTLT